MKEMTARFIENGFSNKQAIVLSDAIRESREELVTKDHFDVELDRVHVELDKVHVEIEQVRVEIREFKLEIGVKFSTFRDEISAKFSTFGDEVSEKLGKQNDEILKLRKFFIQWLFGFASAIVATSALTSALVMKFLNI